MSRKNCRVAACVLLLVATAPAFTAADDSLGLAAPEGFAVSLYAGDELAHDIFSMTIDARGRVVAAGLDYVKILEDTDGDGHVDRAILFSNKPASGAHGMFFDGNDLICTGDNAVMRQRDKDGDGVADGPPEAFTHLKHPEHGANGVIRGPDGWYYVICGNDAGISEKQANTGTSPVNHPRCGGVVRISPDGKKMEVFAHGFRNPYACDFNAAGQLFTVDADGEREHHLPWYAPTRLFDIEQGMEHGWLLQGYTRSWNRPQSYFDNVARMVEIGRGSPTGLVVYRHRQFPERYRGGLFSACWTLGRIYYFPLEPDGASYKSQGETFLRTTGDVGFAPVALAVGPEGDLYVAIGGRRTRGSVFRVRYVGAEKSGGPATRLTMPAEPLMQVLAADQPLSAWSRARWAPIARKLGGAPFESALTDARLPVAARVRAVEILVDLFGGLSSEVADRAVKQAEPAVKARVAWALARIPRGAETQKLLVQLSRDKSPFVERAAWEGLAVLPDTGKPFDPSPDWAAVLESPERRVRTAAILAARGPGAASYRAHLLKGPSALSPAQRLADLRIRYLRDDDRAVDYPSLFFEACVDTFTGTKDTPLLLEAVRLLQLGLGDLRVQPGESELYSGYAANRLAAVDEQVRLEIARKLSPLFPVNDAELNRELARLLGALRIEQPSLPEALAGQWTADSTSNDDIHYLIVLSLLAGERTMEVTERAAAALLGIQAKMRTRHEQPSQNWPLRVGELFDHLCARDPHLAGALVDRSDFGQPEHALFASHLQGAERIRAARKLLAKAQNSEEPATGELVQLIAELPESESFPYLRTQWEDFATRDAAVSAIAAKAREEDRDKFIEGLTSPQPAVVERCAVALAKLKSNGTPTEVARALATLRQSCSPVPAQAPPRKALVALLTRWTGQQITVQEKGVKDLQAAYAPWFDWFVKTYPREAAAQRGFSGEDAAAWTKRLKQVHWSDGDGIRGRQFFERKACHRCHQASGHLGPQLTGPVSRMSREDLFANIIDPNKEVAPAYQTTLITTRSGQVYHGLVVYESPEGTLLQTGPDTTVRILGDERAEVRPSRQSLMPTGLLNDASDRDLADLYAYLKTLAAK